MSKFKDWEVRDRAAESLAIALDVTFFEADKILESMDEEARKEN